MVLCSCLAGPKSASCNVVIALLGLDNAGKTLTWYALRGVKTEDPSATCGQQFHTIKVKNFDIKLFDLPGGKRYRDLWTHYLAEVHGLIYVVDSADLSRTAESERELREVMTSKHISGKPVLVLANKQDLPKALNASDITNLLDLNDIGELSGCPYELFVCSARAGVGRKMHPNLRKGFQWLCKSIHSQYDALSNRIEHEMKFVLEVRREELERKKTAVSIRKRNSMQQMAGADDSASSAVNVPIPVDSSDSKPVETIQNSFAQIRRENSLELKPATLPPAPMQTDGAFFTRKGSFRAKIAPDTPPVHTTILSSSTEVDGRF